MRVAIATETCTNLERKSNAKLEELEKDGSTITDVRLTASAHAWAVLIRYEPSPPPQRHI
jgi:hypothetical protein